MNRIILHIDMDAYFATVAEIVDPTLQNKPVVIGSDAKRGIVSTANYEARKYGIHSAMPIYQAKKLCKDLKIVEPDFKLYEKFTYFFLEIIKKYSKKIEVFSIDECFVDMTEELKNVPNKLDKIKQIQTEIKQELGLSCSIGIAKNKFLAKMASDLKKPYGISIIRTDEIPTKLWPLSIDKMFGIGKKTAPNLHVIGIKTIGDLANFKDEILLSKVLGNGALGFKNLANGIDNSTLKLEPEIAKSIGHETTFQDDIINKEIIKNTLKQLSEKVSYRAKDYYLEGDAIQLTLKYTDFKRTTRILRLNEPTNEASIIYESAVKLLDTYYHCEPIRLVGVSLRNLNKIVDYQKYINKNDKDSYNKEEELRSLISDLNKQLGKKSLMTAREAKR